MTHQDKQTNKQTNNVEKKESAIKVWLREYPKPSTDLKFAPFNFVVLIIIIRNIVFPRHIVCEEVIIVQHRGK
jgi:hypothetical protein